MIKNILILFLFLAAIPACGQDELRALHKELSGAKSNEKKIDANFNLGEYYFTKLYQSDTPFAADSAFYYSKATETLSIKNKNELYLGKSYALQADIIRLHNPDDYKTSLKLLQKAINIFIALKNEEEICLAYRVLVVLQENHIPIDESIALAEKTQKFCKEAGDKESEGRTLEDMAYYISHTGDLKKSVEKLNEALKVYKSDKNVRIKNVYAAIGALYSELGEFDKALQYSLKAVNLAEKYKDISYETVDLYNFTGVIYRGFKKYDEALKYFKKAVSIAKKLNNTGALAFYEANAAEAALLLGKKDEALYFLEEMEKKDSLAYDSFFANSLIVLTKSYIQTGNYEKADKYAGIILDLFEKYKHNPNIEVKYSIPGFASALMEYNFYKKRFNESHKYALFYKDNVIESKSKQKIMNAYHMLYRIDSAQANYKSAMENFRIEHLYRDSLFNEAKNNQLTEMQVKYETNKKDKDNILLKQRAELQESRLNQANLIKNISFAGLLLLCITVGLIYRRYLINQRIRKEINLKNETLENLLGEKEWLLKEIHHRVKNNLQIVISLLNTQSHFLNDETAITAIRNSQNRIHSMSLIHKKLYQSDNVIAVNMEIYIRELVEYFKTSFDTGQHIRFILDVEPIELNNTQSVPLGLILNETVMNSLKHGFPDSKEGIITISFNSFDENRVRLVIRDNGVGYEGDLNSPSGNSLGIKLIKGFSSELNADLKFIHNQGLSVMLEFTNANKNDIKQTLKLQMP